MLNKLDNSQYCYLSAMGEACNQVAVWRRWTEKRTACCLVSGADGPFFGRGPEHSAWFLPPVDYDHQQTWMKSAASNKKNIGLGDCTWKKEKNQIPSPISWHPDPISHSGPRSWHATSTKCSYQKENMQVSDKAILARKKSCVNVSWFTPMERRAKWSFELETLYTIQKLSSPLLGLAFNHRQPRANVRNTPAANPYQGDVRY